MLALAVLSTAFTGLAIGTGFERRYGALKRLGASPLPRGALLGAKGLAVLLIEALQIALLTGVALLLGWHPHGSWVAVLLLVLVGTAAFAGLALLMAGTLLEALPAGALAEGLRVVLRRGDALPWWSVGVLAAWAVVGGSLAARTFRWE